MDADKVRDYYDVIEKPMDLETIQRKVDKGLRVVDGDAPMMDANNEEEEKYRAYTCMEEFKADIKQIFDNARLYNQKETIYYKYAQ